MKKKDGSSILSTVNSKNRLSKRVCNLLPVGLTVVIWMSIQACSNNSNNNNECEKVFVKKSTTSLGDNYQSDALPITLVNPDAGFNELSAYAFRNINNEIKLTFVTTSDFSRFSDEYGDTTLIIFYGSVAKDTLIRFRAEGDKKPGSRFKATTSFRMEDALAADLVVKHKDNQINFALGTYKFVLNDDMYCMLKEMLRSKL